MQSPIFFAKREGGGDIFSLNLLVGIVLEGKKSVS